MRREREGLADMRVAKIFEVCDEKGTCTRVEIEFYDGTVFEVTGPVLHVKYNSPIPGDDGYKKQ